MAINLSRNSRLWVSTVKTGFLPTNTWEIPLQDGFSFSQSTSASDVTVNEAGARPTRGSRRFNEALDPVDWSFTTYLRPYISAADANKHTIVDIILWHALASGVPFNPTTGPVATTATGATVSFTSNGYHELTKLYLFFKVDNAYYMIEDAQVNQAEVSIDIDGIGQTSWSGQGTYLNSLLAADMPAADSYTKLPHPAPNSYLKNKLTTLSLTTNNGDAEDGSVYNIPITGASLTITNNITYLTPSTLAEVDRPIGSFTGSFDVTGSFDAYLNDTAGGTKDLVSYYRTWLGTVNSNAIVFTIGGPTAPNMVITVPTAQLNVPEINIEDVVGMTAEFKGIGTDMAAGDEVNLKFVGAYTQPVPDAGA